MSIKVNITPLLQHTANGVEVTEVNGDTVGQCLDRLVKRFPGIKPALFGENGKLHSYVAVYINGESTYPEELAKLVKDGDELSIALIIGGG